MSHKMSVNDGDNIENLDNHYHPAEVTVAMDANDGKKTIIVIAEECHSKERVHIMFNPEDAGGFLKAVGAVLDSDNNYASSPTSN